MNLVDNLLVLNNLTEHLSLYYDLKNSNPVHTVGSPQSIYVKQNGKIQEENKEPEPQITFDKENPVYRHSTKPMDYSLLIDINNRQIFTYEIDADQVRTLLKDEVIKQKFV